MTEQPILTVNQGQLRGKVSTDFRGGKYYSFQGIPYAKPPLGKLRFKAPQPAEPWTGCRDATQEGNECFALNPFLHMLCGSEDCLFLNVYTPKLPSENSVLKPVMVWIHGGAFTSGSGNVQLYSPDFLITEDVVVVNINYRVGLLGFLSMNDPSLKVPGNAGLKDQVLALKWVQTNIANFGGDPNNVTIFGESAGGASVHYLMLSPMAKGLFNKAIAQSGSALSCWAMGQRSAPLISKALDLPTITEKNLLEILQKMPVEKLVELQEKLPDDFSADQIRPVGPVVENYPKESAFLAEKPIDVIASGNFNKVPLMMGYTTREGMLLEVLTKFKNNGKIKLIEDFENAVPHMLNLNKGSNMSKTVAEKIKHFYYGEEKPSLGNIDVYYLLQTDNSFLWSIYSAIKQQTTVSSSPIFFYRVSIESSLNFFKRMCLLNKPGVAHADDLGYLFKTMVTPNIRPRSIEDIAVYRFTKLWTNFARNGDPNPTTKDSLINVTWKPVQEGQLHFLDIGENLTVGVNPEATRMDFWDEIFNLSPQSSKL